MIGAMSETPSTPTLRTLVVADIVGSTNLLELLGDGPAAELFARHDAFLRATVEAHGGREIDKSDGALLLFDRPSEAVAFALAYQIGLFDVAGDLAVSMQARVGVHTGEVILRPNPPEAVAKGAKPLEVEGITKAIAARLSGLAQPNQVLLTRVTFDLARRATSGRAGFPTRVHWRVYDVYQLNGVAEPIEVCEVGQAGFAPLVSPQDSPKAVRVTRETRPSVLVRPFALPNPDADGEVLADAMLDELITGLAAAGAIRVISRSAASQLKETEKPRSTLGVELGVSYLLEGTIRRMGEPFRMTTHLVRADDDQILWAGKYVGGLIDLIDKESEICRDVAKTLQLSPSEGVGEVPSPRDTLNPQAYEYYLRARQLIYTFSQDGLDRALEFLERGQALEGKNIPITAAMGYVYWQYYNTGLRPDPEYLEQARECAEACLAQQPDSAEGHRLLGLVEVHRHGDLQAAVRHLKIALAANPNDTDALFWLPMLYGLVGRSSSGFPLVEHLLDIDPLTPMLHAIPGLLGVLDGTPDRGLKGTEYAVDLEPANPMLCLVLGQALAMSGQTDRAIAVLESIEQVAPGSFFGGLGALYVAGTKGETAETMALLTDELQDGAGGDPQWSWTVAQALAASGNGDAAVEWVGKAIAMGFLNYPLLAERDPMLQSLRGLLPFKRLMHALKPQWISFQV